jgi:hypothetical protein
MLRAGTHGRGVYEAYIATYVPVELVSFNAAVENNAITLNWITATETNNHGYDVERKLKNEEWEKVGYIKGNGTVTTSSSYSYKDEFRDNPYEGTVLYRLKQINTDGSFEYTKTINVDVNFIPSDFVLYQNYPNPFNPSTNIAFAVPFEAQVKLSVYNQLGEEVSVIANKVFSPGIYNFTWDGSAFSSGIYFYSLEAQNGNSVANTSLVKKLILIK